MRRQFSSGGGAVGPAGPAGPAGAPAAVVLAYSIQLATMQAWVGLAVQTAYTGALPTPCALLRCEVEIVTPLSIFGPGAWTANLALQGLGEAAGDLLCATPLDLKGNPAGHYAPAGANPYVQRDGGQVEILFTLTGTTFDLLIAGDVTVRLYYAPV